MNKDYNAIVGDHVLISHFVKYDRLAELINTEFYNSGYNEINLCIDAYSMIKSIYGLNHFQFISQYSIASCIINACAHYRNFFWTRYKVTCKIWIVFSRMEDSAREARAFYPNYQTIFDTDVNPAMDKVIEDNMEILRILCPYIPDVSFIYSGYEPGLVFGRIAGSEYAYNGKGGNIPTIIVSKDLWNLQVVAEVPNVYMIRPIKKNGEDLSLLISNKNVLHYYASVRKVKADMSLISSNYLPFVIAATRFPERGVKSLHNLSSIIKYLSNAIFNSYISTNKRIYDIPGLCKDLNSFNKVTLKDFEIGLRMDAIGFNNFLFRYMMSPRIDDINIINLHDPDSVKRINETYFSKVPLDLMSL